MGCKALAGLRAPLHLTPQGRWPKASPSSAPPGPPPGQTPGPQWSRVPGSSPVPPRHRDPRPCSLRLGAGHLFRPPVPCGVPGEAQWGGCRPGRASGRRAEGWGSGGSWARDGAPEPAPATPGSLHGEARHQPYLPALGAVPVSYGDYPTARRFSPSLPFGAQATSSRLHTALPQPGSACLQRPPPIGPALPSAPSQDPDDPKC